MPPRHHCRQGNGWFKKITGNDDDELEDKLSVSPSSSPSWLSLSKNLRKISQRRWRWWSFRERVKLPGKDRPQKKTPSSAKTKRVAIHSCSLYKRCSLLRGVAQIIFKNVLMRGEDFSTFKMNKKSSLFTITRISRDFSRPTMPPLQDSDCW